MMTQDELTIRWRNKPLDRLSTDELRRALVDVLDQTINRSEDANPTQSFYAAFVCGMFAGAAFCFGALAIMHGFGA